jgi:AcrR family transcriptional regulator
MPKLTAIRKQALDEMMRGAIFQATVRVLAEHGVKGLTMDRVAAAADLAKGSLYHYFEGKQALLEFVHGKLVDPIFESLRQIVPAARPALEKLSMHLDSLLKHVSQNVQAFELLYQDPTVLGLLQTAHQRAREAASACLSEVFRQGIAEGVFRDVDPLLLTSMFLGLCKGVFDTEPVLERSEQRDQVRQLILDTFLCGIGTEACRRG